MRIILNFSLGSAEMFRVKILVSFAVLGGILQLAPLAVGADAPVQLDPVIRFDNHKFEPTTLTVPAGHPMTLKVVNSSNETIEFESFRLNREKVVSPGSTIKVNIPALSAGTYDFYDDFHNDVPEDHRCPVSGSRATAASISDDTEACAADPLALAAGLITMQFVPVGIPVPHPGRRSRLRRDRGHAAAVLLRLPFRSTHWLVQPRCAARGVVARDIEIGRKEINFSQWNEYRPEVRRRKLQWMQRALQEEGMPPWKYRLMHPEARLSNEDRAAIEHWIETELSGGLSATK